MTNNRESASSDYLRGTVQHKDPIISDEARRVLEIIFYSVLSGVIGVLGSAANIINIIVFVKQGFSDSVGVSLCALAVSDLGFLLPITIFGICFNPLAQHPDIDIDIIEVYHTSAGVLVTSFVRITNLITAFITFERCVCIVLPLKVKNIITPKRTLITMLAVYAIIFVTNLPIFSFFYLAQSINLKRNKSLLLIKSSSPSFPNFSYSFNAFTQISSFISVIICTVVLVVKLLSKSQWRQKSTSSSIDSISTRDKKVMKIVITISTIFIVCYLPSVINLILIVCLSPEYSASGSLQNSYIVSWAIIDSIEGINSSVTILIYYYMSSKFKATFKCVFKSTQLSIKTYTASVKKAITQNAPR